MAQRRPKKNADSKHKNLTKRERAFVQEYLVDLNATQATVRAGYAENRAKQTGYRLLQDPRIQEAIAKAQQEREERTHITQDYVLGSLKEVADQCMASDNWNPQAANKSLELIGKHLGMFVERKEVSGTLTLAQLAQELEGEDGEQNE